MEQIFQQYQNYIYLVFGAITIFLFGKVGSLRGMVESLYSPFEALVQFIAKAHTESDGNGGKPAHNRIMGTVVIMNIIRLALLEKPIPDALMTMFWVLVGYGLISKVLLENPALMELIKGKYGMKTDEPKTP
jgi:hypothetical protein